MIYMIKVYYDFSVYFFDRNIYEKVYYDFIDYFFDRNIYQYYKKVGVNKKLKQKN